MKQKMTAHIRQSNLIENIDDPLEDEQSLLAWEWLMTQKKISNAVIYEIHGMITEHQLVKTRRRCYRSKNRVNVRAGGRLCIHYQLVKSAMDTWVHNLAQSDDPISIHIQFEKIHPFVDGNGRTGRMLLWWQQVRFAQKPTLFKADERNKYYMLFEDISPLEWYDALAILQPRDDRE